MEKGKLKVTLLVELGLTTMVLSVVVFGVVVVIVVYGCRQFFEKLMMAVLWLLHFQNLK